jgi:hypothetical protein
MIAAGALASTPTARTISTLGGATGERASLTTVPTHSRKLPLLVGAGLLGAALIAVVALGSRHSAAPSEDKSATLPAAQPAAPPPAPSPPPPSAPALTKVVIRSEPSGATVTVDGKALGTTPALLSLNLPQEIYLSLAGHQTAKEIITAAGEKLITLTAEKKREPPRAPPKHAAPKPHAPSSKPAGEGLD